jgi:hypothetical protein
MPGYILAHGQATLNSDNIQYPISNIQYPTSNTYQITFDPVTLQQDFPNLDLMGRDEHRAGLADTFAIGLLLQGQKNGSAIYQANTLTFQGEQVFVRNAAPGLFDRLYLPVIIKNP